MTDTDTVSPLEDLQRHIESCHDDRIRDLAREAGVEAILAIPGVWECISEAFNNDAIDANRAAWCEDKGIDAEAPEALEACSKLSRKACAFLLTECAGIEVYDHEDAATLREAVAVNVADGTIEPSDVLGEV